MESEVLGLVQSTNENKTLEIERLAIFSCKEVKEVEEKKRILATDDVKEIVKKLEYDLEGDIADTVQNEGILNRPQGTIARIHEFIDFSADSAKFICDEILNSGEDFESEEDEMAYFESNAEKLARKYYGTEKSREAVIFIFTVRIHDNSFVIIYSSEYIGDVDLFSDDEIIKILEGFFPHGLRKGIVYPYVVDGIIHKDKAKVFQKGNYASYWWKFFDLKEEFTEEEILSKVVAIEIEKLALFSCKGTEGVLKKKRVLKIDELRKINKDLEHVFKRNIAGTIEKRGILNSPHGTLARIHEFIYFSADSAKFICDEILNPGKVFKSEEEEMAYFESKSRELVEKYYKAENSRGAAIFIFTVRMHDNSFVIIYSSEYIEDVASFSDDEIIETLEDVFSRGLKKGIIYPYIDRHRKLHENQTKVFQDKYYASYWWKFFDLKEVFSEDEILGVAVKEEEEKQKKAIIITSTFIDKVFEEYEDAINASATLKCDGIEIKLPLDRLYNTVIPALKDGKKRIVIMAADCSLQISPGQSREIEYRDYDKI